VKASSVFRDNFSGKENRAQTEQQLGPWEPPKRFVQVRTAEQTYQRQPKRDPQQREQRRAERAAEREKLKKEYSGYRSAANKNLTAYRNRASNELRNLAATQRARRAEVRTLNIGSIQKRAMRSVLAAESVRERAALKQRLTDERAEHQPKNYRAWIAERAAQGDAAAISQLRGFLYQDRRRVREIGEHAGGFSIQGAGGGDWREWGDSPDVTEPLRRRKLLTDLQTIQGAVDQRTGHVSYLIDGKNALLDVGQKIYMLDQREATLVAGLEMALQKFGPRLEVTGPAEFKKEFALTAANHGMRVEFTDQTMQQFYQRALELENSLGKVHKRQQGLER